MITYCKDCPLMVAPPNYWFGCYCSLNGTALKKTSLNGIHSETCPLQFIVYQKDGFLMTFKPERKPVDNQLQLPFKWKKDDLPPEARNDHWM